MTSNNKERDIATLNMTIGALEGVMLVGLAALAFLIFSTEPKSPWEFKTVSPSVDVTSEPVSPPMLIGYGCEGAGSTGVLWAMEEDDLPRCEEIVAAAVEGAVSQ